MIELHTNLIIPAREDWNIIRTSLSKGGIMAYPSDTCYAYTTILSSKDGVEKIYELKNRPKEQAVSLAFSDLAMVDRYTNIDDRTRAFIKKFFPGRITLIVKIKPEMFPDHFVTPNDTVGIRIPKDRFTRKLVQSLEEPIITTSANLHGEGEYYYGHMFESHLKQLPTKPDIFIFKKKLVEMQPSTIIDTTKPQWEIVREGKFQMPTNL